MAAYFTHCNLQPVHQILTLRTAVNLFFKVWTSLLTTLFCLFVYLYVFVYCMFIYAFFHSCFPFFVCFLLAVYMGCTCSLFFFSMVALYLMELKQCIICSYLLDKYVIINYYFFFIIIIKILLLLLLLLFIIIIIIIKFLSFYILQLKNFKTAASFARRLLELGPRPDVATQVSWVLLKCASDA